jgi:Uma2 family endonuclease
MDTLAHLPRVTPAEAAGKRRLFTADEFRAMVVAGIIDEAERLELIGGEIVAMSAKGIRHEILRNKLHNTWVRKSGLDLETWSEAPVRLAKTDQPEPDVVVYPALIAYADLTGPDVLVVVEVSASSVSYDLKIKAPLYASYGVREYWVIEADSLITHVHTGPTESGYRSVTPYRHDQVITPAAAHGLAVRLADLNLGWEPDA